MNDEIKIELSKKKIILLLLGATLFVVVSLWIWNYAEIQQRFSSVLMKIIAVVGFLFFGMCFIFGFLKLFDNRPGLIINNDGIVNNTQAAVGNQIVKWENVKGFDVVEIKRNKILLVFVDNANEIISQSNWWEKFWLRQNMNLYGAPVSITSNSLKCSFEELTKIITEYANIKITNI